MLTRRILLRSAPLMAVAAAHPRIGMAQEGTPFIKRLSPALDRIVPADARPELIFTGTRWAEGPLWLPDERALLFSDPPENVVRRWSRTSGARELLRPSGAASFDPTRVREPGANGLALDGNGRLVIADSGSRALVRLDLKTRRRTTLVSRYRGKRFNSPNDLHVAADGTIWFTDPPYGLVDGERSPLRELPHNGVYRWRSGREAVLIDDALSRPNGIALAPDGRTLFVSNSDEAVPRITAYDLDARGDVRDRRLFVDFGSRPGPGLPDGLKIARDGTLFATGPGGVHVLTREGEPLGLIEVGGPVANCAIGEDGRSLFLTAAARVFRLPLAAGYRA